MDLLTVMDSWANGCGTTQEHPWYFLTNNVVTPLVCWSEGWGSSPSIVNLTLSPPGLQNMLPCPYPPKLRYALKRIPLHFNVMCGNIKSFFFNIIWTIATLSMQLLCQPTNDDEQGLYLSFMSESLLLARCPTNLSGKLSSISFIHICICVWLEHYICHIPLISLHTYFLYLVCVKWITACFSLYSSSNSLYFPLSHMQVKSSLMQFFFFFFVGGKISALFIAFYEINTI